LHKFIDAMKRSVRVKVVYRKYGESEVRERVVDPYFVKLTNKRWYGIVHKPDDKGHIFVLGFDRVQSLELIKVLAPQWLADEIKRQHLEAAELYKG
jgi:predicted DNA-binding transcriptional regulator YafY